MKGPGKMDAKLAFQQLIFADYEPTLNDARVSLEFGQWFD